MGDRFRSGGNQSIVSCMQGTHERHASFHLFDRRRQRPRCRNRDIPDIGLTPAEIALPGVWRKLSLYAPELHDLGRVLFVDRDMMVVGPLDDFFAVSRDMTFQNMGDSWRRNSKSDHKEGGTCIFSFDPAEEHGILQAFLENKSNHIGNYGNEQGFAFSHTSSTVFWPNGCVISFKRHLCRRYGAG